MSARALRQTLGGSAAMAFRTVVIGLAIYGGLDLIRGVMAQDDESAYLPAVAKAAQVESLENRVAALEWKLQHVTASTDAITITAANLHVVSGTGATDGITNGLGNVIIGYNEDRSGPLAFNNRSGSHMLVIGAGNNYRSFGGIVAGVRNETSGMYASVTGGRWNGATGDYAAVSGGGMNTASGPYASVSGGESNVAGGEGCSVSGGGGNEALGDYASISGGEGGEASGNGSSVSGGYLNIASGTVSSVSGGADNVASGLGATVSGGGRNVASGGGSSVSGGRERQATDDGNWRAGDLFQPN